MPAATKSSHAAKPFPTNHARILWDAFFFRVNWLNDLADKLEAKGGDGSHARSEIARRAHLTSLQQGALNATAAHYRSASHALFAQILALRNSPSGSNAEQLQDLQNQRIQVVLDHTNQLQTALGNIRFQAFSGYVRGTEAVRAYAGPSATPVPQAGKEPL